MSSQAELFERRGGKWTWRLNGFEVSPTDARLFGLIPPRVVPGERSNARLAYPRLQRDHRRPMLTGHDDYVVTTNPIVRRSA